MQPSQDTTSASPAARPAPVVVPAYRVSAGAPAAEAAERIWAHWMGQATGAPPAALVLAPEARYAALVEALRARADAPATTAGDAGAGASQAKLLRFLLDGGATWIAGGPPSAGAVATRPALCVNATLSDRLLRHLCGAAGVLVLAPWEPNASVALEQSASLRTIPVAGASAHDSREAEL